jgi:hypothetical protein
LERVHCFLPSLTAMPINCRADVMTAPGCRVYGAGGGVSPERVRAAARMVRTLRAELGTEHSVKARNRQEPDCRARQPAMTTTDVLGAFEGYVAAEDGFR